MTAVRLMARTGRTAGRGAYFRVHRAEWTEFRAEGLSYHDLHLRHTFEAYADQSRIGALRSPWAVLIRQVPGMTQEQFDTSVKALIDSGRVIYDVKHDEALLRGVFAANQPRMVDGATAEIVTPRLDSPLLRVVLMVDLALTDTSAFTDGQWAAVCQLGAGILNALNRQYGRVSLSDTNSFARLFESRITGRPQDCGALWVALRDTAEWPEAQDDLDVADWKQLPEAAADSLRAAANTGSLTVVRKSQRSTR